MSRFGFAAQLAEDLSAEDLRLVLEVFRNDVLRLTGSLKAAVAAGEGAAFRRAAHALAGAAGAVGAASLEQACRQAMTDEEAAAAGRADGLLAEIRGLGETALADVAAILAQLDSQP